MGAWNHDYFGNDGAQDLISKLSGKKGEFIDKSLADAVEVFSLFLKRDAEGATFRQLSEDELSENDRLIRDALADVPELLSQWDAGCDEPAPAIFGDTGDHEAQALVAAAAICAHTLFPAKVKLPKNVVIPAGYAASPKLVSACRTHVSMLLENSRVKEQFSRKWIENVTKLYELIDGT